MGTLDRLRGAENFHALQQGIAAGLTTPEERDLALRRCGDFNFDGEGLVALHYRPVSAGFSPEEDARLEAGVAALVSGPGIDEDEEAGAMPLGVLPMPSPWGLALLIAAGVAIASYLLHGRFFPS